MTLKEQFTKICDLLMIKKEAPVNQSTQIFTISFNFNRVTSCNYKCLNRLYFEPTIAFSLVFPVKTTARVARHHKRLVIVLDARQMTTRIFVKVSDQENGVESFVQASHQLKQLLVLIIIITKKTNK